MRAPDAAAIYLTLCKNVDIANTCAKAAFEQCCELENDLVTEKQYLDLHLVALREAKKHQYVFGESLLHDDRFEIIRFEHDCDNLYLITLRSSTLEHDFTINVCYKPLATEMNYFLNHENITNKKIVQWWANDISHWISVHPYVWKQFRDSFNKMQIIVLHKHVKESTRLPEALQSILLSYISYSSLEILNNLHAYFGDVAKDNGDRRHEIATRIDAVIAGDDCKPHTYLDY